VTSSHRLDGIHVPLITPFAADATVAVQALERLAHETLDAGASGIVALGTTGEPATLEPSERSMVLDVCERVCTERGAQLTVGISANSTKAAVAAAAALAARKGVTAVMATAPYYIRPTEEGAVRHLAEIAAGGPLPLVVYNVPYRTARALSAQALLRLAETPNVAAVKHAVGGVDQDTVTLMCAVPEAFSVLAGDDVFAYAMLALGAAGGILASAHVCTADFVRMQRFAAAGNLPAARAVSHALIPLCAALFAEPNPSVIKGVLHAQGRIPTPALRMPMTEATKGAVDDALAAFDVAARNAAAPDASTGSPGRG
jgi:4-hydroxy-tetrahydrodipicolinate synthase